MWVCVYAYVFAPTFPGSWIVFGLTDSVRPPRTALNEAAACDAALPGLLAGAKPLPPFYGVPCTVKENFAVAGMPHTSGLVSRRGAPATCDATAVARLRAAGFIVLGVTNLSELCMWYETNNKVYGRTNNPYCLDRMVGGSSGGEAADVSACGSPCGIGSDIGGSIRMPAFLNGIWGHKPTGGLVPCTGQFPMAAGDACRYNTSGPLCRFAEDLWPMLMSLYGPDGVDPGATHDVATQFLARETHPAQVDLRRVTVFRVKNLRGPAMTTKVETALRVSEAIAAEALCGRAGCSQRVIELPEFADALSMWQSMVDLASETSFRSMMGGGKRLFVGFELVSSLLAGAAAAAAAAAALSIACAPVAPVCRICCAWV